ncbi:MAG: hypothetical protein ABIT61_09445 [Steroidobacteraceae bacterium]
MRIRFAVIGLVATGLTATAAFAHQQFILSGKVVKRTDTTLTVRTAESGSVNVPIGAGTPVFAAGKNVGVKDIKVGQNVEVSTISDTPDDFSDAYIKILGPVR